jgi:hypothetical protein
MMQQQERNLIKKGQFYFIYGQGPTLVLEDKTKRGLEVRKNVLDEMFGVESDEGIIYDFEGKGHKVGIRWYFPKSKYNIEHVIKCGEELEARYKAIRELTCPDDEQ